MRPPFNGTWPRYVAILEVSPCQNGLWSQSRSSVSEFLLQVETARKHLGTYSTPNRHGKQDPVTCLDFETNVDDQYQHSFVLNWSRYADTHQVVADMNALLMSIAHL